MHGLQLQFPEYKANLIRKMGSKKLFETLITLF